MYRRDEGCLDSVEWEWWNNGMVERWNSGMDFFSHPFCLLVCLLAIILWLSF